MKILFYRNSVGIAPIEDFFNSLQPKTRVKSIWVLELLESNRFVSKSFFKKLKGVDELWEVRVDFSNTSIRILSFMPLADEFVLLHGFIKKSTSIPRKEILIAKSRKHEYQNQMK